MGRRDRTRAAARKASRASRPKPAPSRDLRAVRPPDAISPALRDRARGHVGELQDRWRDEASAGAVGGNPRRADYLEWMATQAPRFVAAAIDRDWTMTLDAAIRRTRIRRLRRKLEHSRRRETHLRTQVTCEQLYIEWLERHLHELEVDARDRGWTVPAT